MVSAISLGNLFSFGGKNILSGGNSGLDIATLANSLAAAKAAPASILQQKINAQDKVVSALGEFQQYLSEFKSAANALRNPPGIGNAADNAFAYNSVSLSSNNGTPGDYVSITASPGATLQNFDIQYIETLAKATKQTSSAFSIADADTTGLVVASGATAGQLNAGTLTVNGATIDIDQNDTLNSIAAKFNNVANQTKINANVVKISDGSYILSFTGIVTGEDDAFDLGDAGTVTDPSNVFDQVTFATTQEASDARFRVDGQTITRASNTISDLISGVTIRLKKVIDEDPLDPPTTPTTITASVEADTSTAFDSIVAFFNSYNNLKEFAAKQTKLASDGTYDSTAVLANNSLFRNTLDSIVTQVNATVQGIADGDPNILADIGITFITSAATSDRPEVRNVATIDETELRAALDADFNGVRNLFEFDFNTDNPSLRVFRRSNAATANEFTLNVNPFATQEIEGLSVADADTAFVVATADDEGEIGAGSITVNGETVTLTDGMTLNQVVTAFNAVESNSGLHAAVAESSTGVFTLTFTATRQTGKSNLFDLSATSQDASHTVFGQVDITATGSYSATYDPGTGDTTVDLDGSQVTSSGGFLIKGVAGTAFEGLQMVYGSQAAAQSSVNFSQGIADTIYNTIDGVLNTTDGALKTELESIEDTQTDLSERIDKINEQVDKFREELLTKFASLEAAIAKVNQLLFSLDANDKAKQQFAG